MHFFAKPPLAAQCTRSVLSRQGKISDRKFSKFFCSTFCTLQKVGKRPPQGGGRLPQASQKGGMAAGKEAAERQKKHTECAVPEGTNFLRSGKFQKDLILFVVRCYLGALIRGSQNLGAPCKGTDCYFLRCAKSNQKAHGTPSCNLDSKLYRRSF